MFTANNNSICNVYLIRVPSFCDRKNEQSCAKPSSSRALRNALMVLQQSVFSDSFSIAAFSRSNNPSWLNYKNNKYHPRNYD